MFRGWWIVLTHFVVMFFQSGFYTYAFPALMPAVIDEFQTDATTVNVLFAVVTILGVVIAPVAGPLVDRWSARGLMLIGVVCLVLGLLGLSVAETANQFVLIGGLLFAISGSMLGPMCGSAVVSRFFTATRGRAMGIASIGTSLGGIVIANAVGLSLVEGGMGWRAGLQALAVLVGVIALPLLLFRFWDSPEAAGATPEPSPAGAPQMDLGAPATNAQILGRSAFWFFSLSLSLFLAAYTGTLANLGKHFADIGLEPEQRALLLGLVPLGGVLGKLGFGYASDRIPLRLGLAAAIGLTAVAIYLLSIEPGFGLAFVAAAVLGIATGGILPVWNAMVPALFGVVNFGRTMGLMSPVISVTTAPAFLVVGWLRDSTGSYVSVFQGFLLVLAVAMLLILPIRIGAPASAE